MANKPTHVEGSLIAQISETNRKKNEELQSLIDSLKISEKNRETELLEANRKKDEKIQLLTDLLKIAEENCKAERSKADQQKSENLQSILKYLNTSEENLKAGLSNLDRKNNEEIQMLKALWREAESGGKLDRDDARKQRDDAKKERDDARKQRDNMKKERDDARKERDTNCQDLEQITESSRAERDSLIKSLVKWQLETEQWKGKAEAYKNGLKIRLRDAENRTAESTHRDSTLHASTTTPEPISDNSLPSSPLSSSDQVVQGSALPVDPESETSRKLRSRSRHSRKEQDDEEWREQDEESEESTQKEVYVHKRRNNEDGNSVPHNKRKKVIGSRRCSKCGLSEWECRGFYNRKVCKNPCSDCGQRDCVGGRQLSHRRVGEKCPNSKSLPDKD